MCVHFLSKVATKYGFPHSTFDHSVFACYSFADWIILIVYVDDLTFFVIISRVADLKWHGVHSFKFNIWVLFAIFVGFVCPFFSVHFLFLKHDYSFDHLSEPLLD